MHEQTPFRRSRSRVDRALGHGDTDRVPFDAFAFPTQWVGDWREELGLDDESVECLSHGDFTYLEFEIEPKIDELRRYVPDLPEDAYLDEWGVGRERLRTSEGYEAGSRLYCPLERVSTLRDLETFPLPDVSQGEHHRHLETAVAAAVEREFTVLGQMSQSVLELAYSMRGMNRLFVDFSDRPRFVRTLFERITERRCFQARRFAEVGVDVLRIGDDIATQQGLLIGPDAYREWVKPYHARIIKAARAVNPDIHVLYHSDGRLDALLSDLIEIGVTAINPCQPEAMPPMEVKRRFGDKLTLWGCCSTQSIYATGTPIDVGREVKMLTGEAATGGGLVIQFYNTLLTPTVKANIKQFVKSFTETYTPK